jgi:hypothetical protein
MRLNRRKKRWLVASIAIVAILIVFRHFFLSIYFVAFSHIVPPDLDYVRKEIWSYEKGFKIGQGDFVDFYETDGESDCKTQTFFLRNDTVFYKCLPRATVTRTNKYFGEVVVKSINTKQEGSYSNNPDLRRL